MAKLRDVILGQFGTGMYLIEKCTADLADHEYFLPAVEGTNHTAWILGHLACTEDWAVSLITGHDKRIDQATHERFQGGSVCVPDASKYPARNDLDELFRNTRANTLEALKAFDEGRWDEPSPDESLRDFFPTLGSIWGMQATHQFWHIGQLTVCRKVMNKKPMLG